MKYFKEGTYYVNLVHPSFRSVFDDEDFTDVISDFSKLSYLGLDVTGDTIRLINTPDKGFIFVRYPLSNERFIKPNEFLKIKNDTLCECSLGFWFQQSEAMEDLYDGQHEHYDFAIL